MRIIVTKKYKIADKVFEMTTFYEYTHKMCADYKTDLPADHSIIISSDDIEKEQVISEKTHLKEKGRCYHFEDDYIESLAVYRKMSEILLFEDTILFHGSVIAVDGKAFLFTAKSGTGKSTHTANWRKLFGERAVMINDDKPLIRITDKEAVVYGTPWDGKHHLNTNTSVPLKAVCVLTRSETNHIEKISVKDCYNILLQQTYRPKNPSMMAEVLKLIDRFSEKTELYRLGCNMDVSSAEVAYNGMKG